MPRRRQRSPPYNSPVPDREIAARLAALRRASVDIERRLRADDFSASDSCDYWRGQIDEYRSNVDGALATMPFPQRAIQQVPRVGDDTDRAEWPVSALEELTEVRTRLDAAIARLE
jgi:hypothetical protein